jgi:hypothetical protein
MNIIGIIILVIGIIITIVGGVRFVIAALEESVWWGFGVLCPIVSPIFLILHFDDAWRPALNYAIGFALVLLGTFLRFAAQG